MVEMERATKTIEIGNGCMATALEGTTGRIRRDNDNLESRCIKCRNEEFITINIMGREETFATWIVDKFISNTQASPKFIWREGLIVMEEFNMWAGTGNTASIGLSVSNSRVQ
jgi:hypothetical protein